jgi:hypothetical protein
MFGINVHVSGPDMFKNSKHLILGNFNESNKFPKFQTVALCLFLRAIEMTTRVALGQPAAGDPPSRRQATAAAARQAATAAAAAVAATAAAGGDDEMNNYDDEDSDDDDGAAAPLTLPRTFIEIIPSTNTASQSRKFIPLLKRSNAFKVQTVADLYSRGPGPSSLSQAYDDDVGESDEDDPGGSDAMMLDMTDAIDDRGAPVNLFGGGLGEDSAEEESDAGLSGFCFGNSPRPESNASSRSPSHPPRASASRSPGQPPSDSDGPSREPSAAMQRLLDEIEKARREAIRSTQIGALRFWVFIPNRLLRQFNESISIIEEVNNLRATAAQTARIQAAARNARAKAPLPRATGDDPTKCMKSSEIAAILGAFSRVPNVGQELLTNSGGTPYSMANPDHPLHFRTVFSPDQAIADPGRQYPKAYQRPRSYVGRNYTHIRRAEGHPDAPMFSFRNELNVFELTATRLSVRSVLSAGIPEMLSAPSRNGGDESKDSGAVSLLERSLSVSTLARLDPEARSEEHARNLFLQQMRLSGCPPESLTALADTYRYAVGCAPGSHPVTNTHSMRELLKSQRSMIHSFRSRVITCPDISGPTLRDHQLRAQLTFKWSLATYLAGVRLWNRVARPNSNFFSIPTEGVLQYLRAYADANEGSLFNPSSYAFSNLSFVGSYVTERMAVFEVTYKINTAHEIVFHLWISNHNASDPNAKAKRHIVFIGAASTGKSYAGSITKRWIVDSALQSDMFASRKSAYSPVDNSGIVTYIDEANPVMFGIGPSGKIQATAEAAEFKQQTTDDTLSFTILHVDDDGVRRSIKTTKPNNGVMQMNTNEKMTNIPEPIVTRFIWVFCAANQRHDVSTALQVCAPEEASSSLVQNDCENMKWENSMIHWLHAMIGRGVIPEFVTPFARHAIPELANALRANGVPELAGEARVLKRTLSGVRALGMVGVVRRVWGSPSSPLCPLNPAYDAPGPGADPLDATQALYAVPHMTDSADPSVLVTVLGMDRHQYIPEFYVEIIEAMRVLLFPIEANQNSALAEGMVDADEEEAESAARRERSAPTPTPRPLPGLLGFPRTPAQVSADAHGKDESYVPSPQAADTRRQLLNTLQHMFTKGPLVRGCTYENPPDELGSTREDLVAASGCNGGEEEGKEEEDEEEAGCPLVYRKANDPVIPDESHYAFTPPHTLHQQRAFVRRERALRRHVDNGREQDCEDTYTSYTKDVLPAKADAAAAKGTPATWRSYTYLQASVTALGSLCYKIANRLSLPRDVVAYIFKILLALEDVVDVFVGGEKKGKRKKLNLFYFDKIKGLLHVHPELFRRNVPDVVLRSLRSALETDCLTPFVAVFGTKAGVYGKMRLVGFIPDPTNPTKKEPTKKQATSVSRTERRALYHHNRSFEQRKTLTGTSLRDARNEDHAMHRKQYGNFHASAELSATQELCAGASTDIPDQVRIHRKFLQELSLPDNLRKTFDLSSDVDFCLGRVEAQKRERQVWGEGAKRAVETMMRDLKVSAREALSDQLSAGSTEQPAPIPPVAGPYLPHGCPEQKGKLVEGLETEERELLISWGLERKRRSRPPEPLGGESKRARRQA